MRRTKGLRGFQQKLAEQSLLSRLYSGKFFKDPLFGAIKMKDRVRLVGAGRETSSVKPLPKLSVIIPVRPEEDICSVIDSLKEVDYPKECFEIITVQGRWPSKQRNEAAKIAQGEIIYFLDNDSVVHRNLFKPALTHYQEKDTSAVCGPNLMLNANSLFEECVERVFTSFFGTFGIRARYKAVGQVRRAKEEDVILCNFSVRKQVFEDEGGFNESLYPNEETEFQSRVTSSSSGRKIIYDPKVIVSRGRPGSLLKYFCKIFGYGSGRANQTLRRPSLSSLKFTLPGLAVVYAVIALFVRNILLFVPFLAYGLCLMLVVLAEIFKQKKISRAALLFFLYPLTHLAYGVGILWGLLRWSLGRKRPGDTSMTINTVKAFGESL